MTSRVTLDQSACPPNREVMAERAYLGRISARTQA